MKRIKNLYAVALTLFLLGVAIPSISAQIANDPDQDEAYMKNYYTWPSTSRITADGPPEDNTGDPGTGNPTTVPVADGVIGILSLAVAIEGFRRWKKNKQNSF